jgi:hypothetical protein
MEQQNDFFMRSMRPDFAILEIALLQKVSDELVAPGGHGRAGNTRDLYPAEVCSLKADQHERKP